jgi:hypothetical protein
MCRMPKILLTIHSGRLENFRINAYFDFSFRVRQFPFNPGHLTFFSAPRLIKGPFEAGFTVIIIIIILTAL